MLFNQADQLQFGPILRQQPNQNEIRFLPQFFRADADMVWRLGGPFLRHVLDTVPISGRFKYVSIDTRTHLLFPRMYPSIPGWHCDDFYRPTDDQPDLARVMEKAPSVHHCVVFGNTAFTEYATEPIDLPAPEELSNPDRKPAYGIYHRLIEERRPRIRAVQSGELVRFSPLVFHRGVAATARGWRYFLRLTESNHWEPLNEIRTQTQVYLTEAFYEW
jgi:hypothetical protein